MLSRFQVFILIDKGDKIIVYSLQITTKLYYRFVYYIYYIIYIYNARLYNGNQE